MEGKMESGRDTLLLEDTSVSRTRTRMLRWTLNNYTDEDVTRLQTYAKDKCAYMVFGYEVAPTTGTPHLQGYHYWENPHVYPNAEFRRLTAGPDGKTRIRDFLCNASPKSNRDYCSKDCKIWEYGEIPRQGARTDWTRAQEQLKSDHIIDVIEEQPHLIPFVKALERVKQLYHKPLHRDVNVITLIGDAGTGKSRWAYETYPDLYSKPEGYWWDGYDGEKTILLDDYYGDIPYSQFLKVSDRYPLRVPIKGGFVNAQWTTVIITSNRDPANWYVEGMTPALERRLKDVRYIHNTKNAIEDYQEEGHVSQEEGTTKGVSPASAEFPEQG